jgi:dTDP-4-amino-4,6-dideoxygalactose transaminase
VSTTPHLPLVDLPAQLAEVEAEVRAGLEEVFRTAAFVGGPQVTAFEEAYARFCSVEHCVGVANGTDALELALRAVGVDADGEVVLPANSFVATAEAVARIGARPVLVDVTPGDLLMDPKHVASAITANTQAVVPVHLFGRLADMASIEAAVGGRCPVVEDAAQSQGATRDGRSSGAFGTVAATSFYPGKNLGAAGDAGAVTTDDPELAATVRLLAAHGSRTKYVHEVMGFNSRLDTVQAVVLGAKLTRLQQWNDQRRAAARVYDDLLGGLAEVELPASAGEDHVWHLYVVRVPDRDRVLHELQEQGIGAGVHYPQPLSLTPALSYLGHGPGDFPEAELAAGQILSLPLFPQITPEQQERVAVALRAALAVTA